MEVSKERLEELKAQILEQINSTFPEDKKQSAIEQVSSMNDEQFIEFLKQNNLMGSEGNSTSDPKEQQCIFCSIVFGDVPSTKIGENEKAMGILEINPISKGHTLLIPKNHLSSPEEIEKEVYDLSNEIIEKLQKAFAPKEVQLIPAKVMGHQIINLLPVYTNETINSPKKQSSPEELKELKEEIENLSNNIKTSEEESPKKRVEKTTSEESSNPTEEINEENLWLPKRIP